MWGHVNSDLPKTQTWQRTEITLTNKTVSGKSLAVNVSQNFIFFGQNVVLKLNKPTQ